MSIIWILIIILLLIIEIMTVDLYSIWYVLSGIISFIISYFKNSISTNFLVQLIICIIFGTILLFLFRKKTIAYLKSKNIIYNKDKQVGLIGIVSKRITKTKDGQIRINNKTWNASSDKKLLVGTKVKVISVDGEKLRVKEKEK